MGCCEACGRPVALPRPTCAYCGAPLLPEDIPRQVPPATTDEAPPPPSDETRDLLILDVRGRRAEDVAAALGIASWEGEQIVRRGGDHLVGTYSDEEAEALAEASRTHGLRTFRVPADEARRPPVRAVRGSIESDGLVLGSEGCPTRRLHLDEILLLVEGPITRSLQASSVRRRVSFHGIGEGFRFHLHLRNEASPLELDPESFQFLGVEPVLSGFLEMRRWFEALPAGSRDAGFRHITPALTLACREATELVTGLTGGRKGAEKEGGVVLDNVAQFRLYSGWRGAVERRR